MPDIRRLFLPVDRVEASREEEDRALDGYRRLLMARVPDVKSLANQLEDAEPDLGVFTNSVKTFIQTWKTGGNETWTSLEKAVAAANEIEKRVRQSGGEAPPTPSDLDEREINAIREQVRGSFPKAKQLCLRLAQDDELLAKVFDPKAVPNAKVGMVQIADQIDRYLASDSANVRVDDKRALDSSGTLLQNQGRGALDKAIMTVTKSWADCTTPKKLSDLVHEASHGAETATADHAYLHSWNFDALDPNEQLENAPHYEGVAQLALGLRQEVHKPLATNVNSENKKKLLTLLSQADKWVTKRRLATGYVLRFLNTSRLNKLPVAATEKFEKPMLVIADHLQLPCGPHVGRSGFTTATNLDVELFGLFRRWLEQIHRTLSNLDDLKVQRGDQFTLSEDRKAAVVPITWAMAQDEQVEAFVSALAAGVTPIAGSSPEDLIEAMRSIPGD